jgi:hypothetical protein
MESPTRHVIIGFHIVGEGANELIQLGSILVNAGTTLEELSNTPFAAVVSRMRAFLRFSMIFSELGLIGRCSCPHAWKKVQSVA